ncbi:MAG: hypothetical protein R3F56_17765 [Planctomycetota bacterium]
MSPTTTVLLHDAGRSWARSATATQRARAERVLRVATPAANPHVVLRFVLGTKDDAELQQHVVQIFGGAASLEAVKTFATGAATV